MDANCTVNQTSKFRNKSQLCMQITCPTQRKKFYAFANTIEELRGWIGSIRSIVAGFREADTLRRQSLEKKGIHVAEMVSPVQEVSIEENPDQEEIVFSQTHTAMYAYESQQDNELSIVEGEELEFVSFPKGMLAILVIFINCK